MTSSSGSEGRLEDAESAALIAGEDLLSRDDIPDENQQIECFSCGQTMAGLFCHGCGQKNDDYRRSIWSLFSETFASVFSLENRMWRTWLVLLAKPGRVAREFSDGKRTSWTSPVRIYLAMSIILFGYMGLTETRIFSVRTDIIPMAGFTGQVEDLDDSSVKLVPVFGFFRRQADLDRLNSGTDFDRVTRLMHGIPRQVFVFDGDLTPIGGPPSDELLRSNKFWPSKSDVNTIEANRKEALDTFSEHVDVLVDRYNDLLRNYQNPETIGTRIVQAELENAPLEIEKEFREGSTEAFIASNLDLILSLDRDLEKLNLSRSDLNSLPLELKKGFSFTFGSGMVNGVEMSTTDVQDVTLEILRNPALLNEGVSRYLPRIMFLMMPFAALIGLIFIRDKRRALLYDHLVHATYIHAVTFAFLFILILLSQWSQLDGVIYIFFLGISIYLPLSAKAMFKRGWFKTIFASYSIAALYGFAMFMIVIALTTQSIIYAADLSQV